MIKIKIIEKTLGNGEIIPLTFDPIFTNIFNNEENLRIAYKNGNGSVKNNREIVEGEIFSREFIYRQRIYGYVLVRQKGYESFSRRICERKSQNEGF